MAKALVSVLLLAAVAAAPSAARAFTGVGGCSSLPEYYRALGALQGNMESACEMSVAQARHILAGYGDVPGAPPLAPAPRAASHRHRAAVR